MKTDRRVASIVTLGLVVVMLPWSAPAQSVLPIPPLDDGVMVGRHSH